MSVIISWEQLLTSQRLPSGDVIRLTVSTAFHIGSRVEFVLVTSPVVTWEKRIRFFDARNELAFLRTEGSNHRTGPTSFHIDSFDRGGLRVELVKAMTFGTLTGVYELTNVKRWKGHSLLFEWLTD